MKWLKYKHKFSSGYSGWKWIPVGDDATEKSVEDDGILDDLVNQYNYSDKYSGVDFEIVDKAPIWVIERYINDLGDRVTRASVQLNEFRYLLANGVEDCTQCTGATVATSEHYKQYGTGTTIKPCPACGQEILYNTLKYILMPDDADAVKLLGSLVEQGARSVKSKNKFRWPVDGEDEENAYHRLSKLGLAGGSVYQDVYKIFATKSGESEWLKHKK